MVQDLIGPLLLCAVLGSALALLVAASFSQLSRNLTLSSIAARLLLAVGPAYLAAQYVIDQGALPMAAAGGFLIFGLYCLRGWWAPEYSTVALATGYRINVIANALSLPVRRQTTAASQSLRYRMFSVVDADRRLDERMAEIDRRSER